MEMKFIDIHSHLSFADYGGDRDALLARMRAAGVGTITVGTDLASSIEAVRLAEKHDGIWASIGVHPKDNPSLPFAEHDFAELAKHPKVVAIGECGLDYFSPKGKEPVSEAEKSRQKKEFIKQIEFSVKYGKPLMLHIRDAHDDAYEILKKYPKARGNLHFFTASSEVAKKFIDLGFTVSFPGVITFAKETQEAVKNIPLDKMHAETDSPFAAPVPYRGKRNEPTYVIEIVKKIAELRGEDFEKVREQLLENARKTFTIGI
ncbi:MAG: TatD family hydrolase [Patescibacteria group bacterium]|nr:TatD family hydrolase [Patescibacteria group bacterium]MDE1945790.1 TatD family hydrolase [Patescibacteria group bacterium]